MITSSDVNRALRTGLEPTLRELGFTRLKSRHYWRYFPDCVWALHLKAVGSFFSSVTGFPPASLVVELGVYYLNFPSGPIAALDPGGQPIPGITDCQVRLSLVNQRNQIALRPASMLGPERSRTDIWWLNPDGSNLLEAVEDIREAVVAFGIPFLEKPYNTRSEQIRRRGLGGTSET